MKTKTQSDGKSDFFNKMLYAIASVLIIIIVLNDLLINKSSLNFRIILELFFIPYIVLKVNLGVNLSKERFYLIKTGLNIFWAIISLIFGILGFIEIILSISLFSIEGDVVTILSFSIGILLVLSIIKYFLFDSDFNRYKGYIKIYTYLLIGLNGIIIAMLIFTNLVNIDSIHFGTSTSGTFVLDIIFTLSFLVAMIYFLFMLWQEEPKIKDINSFLQKTIPGWFVLTLTILLFFQLFIIYLINSNITLGSGLFQDSIKNSLFTGSIYLLLGIGLTMIYKLLGFANFSHGELVIFGSYVSIMALDGISYGFIPDLVLFILVSFTASALLALMGDLFVFRPLRNRNAEAVTFMVASIGLSIIIRFSITNIFGVDSRGVIIDNAPLLNVVKYMIIILAVVFVLMLELLLKKTKIGKAMRAMADNPKLAQASGISPLLIIALVWVIGSGFAGVGGLFRLLANATLIPSLGFTLLLPTFAVVILGGIGSYRGAIIAGYVIGFAENFGTFIMIFFRQLKENFIIEVPIILGDLSVKTFNIKPSFSQEYQFAIGFLILILVLLVKPTGILGEELVRER